MRLHNSPVTQPYRLEETQTQPRRGRRLQTLFDHYVPPVESIVTMANMQQVDGIFAFTHTHTHTTLTSLVFAACLLNVSH